MMRMIIRRITILRTNRFHLQDKDLLKNLREKDRDSDAGLNPELEKVVTIGGIIVAVVIGCVFLALLANAFGI